MKYCGPGPDWKMEKGTYRLPEGFMQEDVSLFTLKYMRKTQPEVHIRLNFCSVIYVQYNLYNLK